LVNIGACRSEIRDKIKNLATSSLIEFKQEFYD